MGPSTKQFLASETDIRTATCRPQAGVLTAPKTAVETKGASRAVSDLIFTTTSSRENGLGRKPSAPAAIAPCPASRLALTIKTGMPAVAEFFLIRRHAS